MAAATGVYPCYENQFQIDTAASGATAAMKSIADCETFEVSFDNGVEEWNSYDAEGWIRRLMTAKAVTISVTAKRNVGGQRCSGGPCLEEWPERGKGLSMDVPGWNGCEIWQRRY